jgi:hypothetical protein
MASSQGTRPPTARATASLEERPIIWRRVVSSWGRTPIFWACEMHEQCQQGQLGYRLNFRVMRNCEDHCKPTCVCTGRHLCCCSARCATTHLCDASIQPDQLCYGVPLREPCLQA